MTATQPPLEPEPRRRGGAMGWALAIIGLLLIGLVAGWFVLQKPADTRVQTVQVPDNLLHQPQPVAEAAVRAVGLVPQVTTTQGADDGTVGQVVKVDPVSGTTVEANSRVNLTVNGGPERIAVPGGLVGLSEADARAALRSAGLTNIQVVEASSEPAGAAAGSVVSVSPQSGQKVAANDQITLSVASGEVEMPNLAGMTLQEATARLAQAGFTQPLQYQERPTTGEDVGHVVGQEPARGSTVAKDTTVIVTIGVQAPTPTATPQPTATTAPPAAPAPTPSATETETETEPDSPAPTPDVTP